MSQNKRSIFREEISCLVKPLEVINNNHFTKFSDYQYYGIKNGNYDYSNMLVIDARYTIGQIKFQALDLEIRKDMLNQLTKYYPINMEYAEFVVKEILKIFMETGYANSIKDYEFKKTWMEYYSKKKKDSFITFETKIFFERVFETNKYLNVTTSIVFKTRKHGDTFQAYPALLVTIPQHKADYDEYMRHTISIEPNIKEICRVTCYGHKIDVITLDDFKKDINELTYSFQARSAIRTLKKNDYPKLNYKKFIELSKKEQQDLIDLAKMLNY
jgi:hypothetical protein